MIPDLGSAPLVSMAVLLVAGCTPPYLSDTSAGCRRTVTLERGVLTNAPILPSAQNDSMSTELPVAFNAAWIGAVNLDELFEALDPEGGKRSGPRSLAFRAHSEGDI